MKMHLTATTIAMFLVSGTALAQSSDPNPHAWGNDPAPAASLQAPSAREAGTGLVETAREPRIAREAGTGLVESAEEPRRIAGKAGTGLTGSALQSMTREPDARPGETPGPWGKVW